MLHQKYKEPFEKCISVMDELLENTILSLKKALDECNMEKINFILSDYSPRMETTIKDCSAIINSKEFTNQQDVFGDYFDDEDEVENINAQDFFDNLFV